MKPKIAQKLCETIINRSLLFLGYGYGDPNIQAIMAQAYQLMNKITNTHYILLDELIQEQGESDRVFKQKRIRRFLWISELNRIGILELVVPREEIQFILRDINKEAHQTAIFVTGSHKIDSISEEYANDVGRTIASIKGTILNNGQSSGIGNAVLYSFMKYVVENKQDINSRIRIFPNPYAISPNYADNPALIPNLKKARIPLISNSTLIIAFPGNIGTNAEIEIARAKGITVVPIVWSANHYSSLAISNLLNDKDNMSVISEYANDYCEKLERRTPPDKNDILNVIRKMINGKA